MSKDHPINSPAPQSSGMVLAPLEPTEEMIKAGQAVSCNDLNKRRIYSNIYKAMLSAKPSVAGEKK